MSSHLDRDRLALIALQRLRAAGFVLRAEVGKLLVRPAETLSAADRAAIVKHRDGLLTVLSGASVLIDPATFTPYDRWIIYLSRTGVFDR